MSDVVDRISDLDNKEEERRLRVNRSSSMIFDCLWDALKERVERYNERHPQDRFFPNAVVIHRDWDSQHFKATIHKNIQPKNSLRIQFPINSGEMTCKLTLANGRMDAAITLDVSDGKPLFYMEGEAYSDDTIADTLLAPILSTKWPPAMPTTASKRLIGFKP
jgi:hypothetical protein